MYKLFLCLRYLRRRYIALVAIVGMALCVFMVLVVVSVFNGFLDTVQNAARGMMGDVIIDVAGGLPRYEHFLAETRTLPEVTTVTPVIYAYGLLRVGSTYTHTVRVVGLRLPEAAEVSTFEEGLWPEGLKQSPRFEVPAPFVQELGPRSAERLEALERRIDERIARHEAQLAAKRAEPADRRNAEEIAALEMALEEEKRDRQVLPELLRYDAALPRIILGVDIPGTTLRDSATGQYERRIQVGQKVQLTLLPISRGVTTLTEPVRKAFTYIGDSRMGIYGVDNMHVYVDFDALQALVDMNAKVDAETGLEEPALCTQVQAKLGPVYLGASLEPAGEGLGVRAVVEDSPAARAGLKSGHVLLAVDGRPVKTVDEVRAVLADRKPGQSVRLTVDTGMRVGEAVHVYWTARLADPRQAVTAVQAMYARFAEQYPDVPLPMDASIQTWEQKQRPYVEPIEKQRTLTAIMFSIISMVAVVLVFAIFYMMVVQRTRDIGVLKSIGASSLGVAGIYLLYGCAIGLVGSAAGALSGYFFVRHINPIHDWVADTFHYRLFDRQAYLFDTIPNRVEPTVIAIVVVGAMLAGLVGSVLPAMRAARMQPVEALRYE